MEKLQFLKRIYDLVKNPNNESLKLSMQDVHIKGLFSLVIDGTEHGKLTRIFIACERLKPYQIQLHTHRYPIQLTTIRGNIKHFVAQTSSTNDCENVQLSEFEYKSPMNGGDGLRYIKESQVKIRDYHLPIGATLKMTEFEYHTVACSKGSIWIVEEQGFSLDSSLVLGVPFVTENLYNAPTQFQINDKCQIAAKEIKKLILDYELV